MDLPFFYVSEINESIISLDETNSKHIVTVLRMEKGEELLITNGKGKKAQAIIIDDNRKKCTVQISHIEETKPAQPSVTIGISLIKNSSRFEWFLEKATEIGVNEILPLICERTEKEKFKSERMQQILINAMLQSQQSWLPKMHEPTPFKNLLNTAYSSKMIAHCNDDEKRLITQSDLNNDCLLLIGPEGDFSKSEIDAAISNGFKAVSLGNTRLRTETAGIVGASLLCARRISIS
jgi:16S rRNA (uracil1498-N3)-methyltransferase